MVYIRRADDTDAARVPRQDGRPIGPFHPSLELFHRPGRGRRVGRLRRQYRVDHVILIAHIVEHNLQTPGQKIEDLFLRFAFDLDGLRLGGFLDCLGEVEINIVLDQRLDHADRGPAQPERILGAGGGQACREQTN